MVVIVKVACVAGGIVGARETVLAAQPLEASGEAARNTAVFQSLPSHSPRGF